MSYTELQKARNLHLKKGDLVRWHDNEWLGGDKVSYVIGFGIIIEISQSRLYAVVMSGKKRIVELKYLELVEELSKEGE